MNDNTKIIANMNSMVRQVWPINFEPGPSDTYVEPTWLTSLRTSDEWRKLLRACGGCVRIYLETGEVELV